MQGGGVAGLSESSTKLDDLCSLLGFRGYQVSMIRRVT